MNKINNDCCIVIPIYNITPSYFEDISILNVIDLYRDKYDIVFIHPNKLNIDSYKKYDLSFIEYTKWNGKINSYNNMCLSLDFYELFSNYNYILLSQTDSLILNDYLDDWMSKNYDYIGAPEIYNILNRYDLNFNHYNFNGGFSLRKVNSFIKAIKYLKTLNISNTFYEDGIYSLLPNNILSKCPLNTAKYFAVSHYISNNNIPNYYNENFDTSKIFGIHKFDVNNISFSRYNNPEFFEYIKPKIFNRCFYIVNKYYKETYKKDCVIIIPVYNKNPKFLEEISILNTIKLYSNKYDIYIIYSENLDISYYTKRFYDVKFVKIDNDIWDNTYEGYNKMCLNGDFYSAFLDYKYMFLVQTDAHIFSSDLNKWLEMNYDYYGGPSLITNDIPVWNNLHNEFLYKLVEEKKYYNYNGGLCIRNINKFMHISNLLPLLYYEYDSEDIIFSTINAITNNNIINYCPYEKVKLFSNDYDISLTNEEINNLFGCHNIHRVYSMVDYDKVLDKYKLFFKKINEKYIMHISNM